MFFSRFPQFEIRRLLRTGVCFSVCAALLWTSGGCLRRRMTINSNPPGATVYVDGHQIGKTPVSTDFTYYGTRNIRLEMDNYQTMVVKQKVLPPWYEYPVFDFFSETFSAGEVKDNHVWTYDMQQRAISSDEQILARARDFAFEGSRTVNPDGTLGTPVTAENYPYRRPSLGQNPDPGFETPVTAPMPTTEPLIPEQESTVAPPASSEPTWNSLLEQQQQERPSENVPPANPNAFPSGSADWDTPSRYPGTN